MTAAIVYVATADREQALSLGRTLVEERLAACANVLYPMTSVYWWDGAVQSGEEAVLILKTRQELVAQVIERVKALHTYECPGVVSWPLEAGNAAYFAWIDDETIAPPP